MKFNSAIIFFAIIFFITSCERQVSLDLPYDGDKLVLNSIFKNDSVVYAKLTVSQPVNFNSFNYTVPAGAAIKLYENDVYREDMQMVQLNGVTFFRSTAKTIIGKKYTLKATATGFTDVEGADVIPAAVPFVARNFREVATANNTTEKLTVVLPDPAGVTNYYRLRIFSADTNLNATGPRYFKGNELYFQINEFSGNGGFDLFGDSYDSEFIFSDETFNGREFQMNVDLDYYGGNDYVMVELTALTKETYRYLKSSNSQQLNQDNPFVEPTTVYNNIRNGYGITGGAAVQNFFIKKQ